MEQQQAARPSKAGSRIWAVGSGKGGVGKSVVTTNLAFALAERNLEVVLADADLGGANLHTMLGIGLPATTLGDLLSGRASSLEQVLLPTGHPRVKLLAGASGILGLADPNFRERSLLVGELERLDADIILLDLGAGTSLATIDFWNAAGRPVVVTSPEPTAVQNAYSFLKIALQRRIQRAVSRWPRVIEQLAGPTGLFVRLRAQAMTALLQEIAVLDAEAGQAAERAVTTLRASLVVNRAAGAEAAQTARALAGVARFFLGLDLPWVGAVPDDPEISRSVRQLKPYLLGLRGDGGGAASGAAALALRELSVTLLRGNRLDPGTVSGRPPERPSAAPPAAPHPAARAPSVRAVTPRRPGNRGETSPWNAQSRELTRPVPGMLQTRAEDLQIGRRVFHVQTEDLGLPAAEVLSVVYEQGRILLSRRTSYGAVRDRADLTERVRLLVDRQHQRVKAEVLAAPGVAA